MAIRRMFSKRVIETTSFLRMPATAQALYYNLGMQADDDGVVEAFMVLRMVGASEDDLKLLHEKGFVYILNDELVTYITDFRENNKLRADRKVDSRYQQLVLEHLPDTVFLESRTRADLKGNVEENEHSDDADGQMVDNGQTMDVQRSDNGRPTVSPMPEEDRVVEVSSVEDSSDQFRSVDVVPKEPQQPQEKVTSFVNYQSFVDEYHQRCPSLRKIKALTPERKQRLKALLAKYTIEQILLVFDKAQASALLRGECSGKGYENFIAGFDWIINEDNFVKIFEGKYDPRGQPGYYSDIEGMLIEN